jgi:hypothetical protein
MAAETRISPEALKLWNKEYKEATKMVCSLPRQLTYEDLVPEASNPVYKESLAGVLEHLESLSRTVPENKSNFLAAIIKKWENPPEHVYRFAQAKGYSKASRFVYFIAAEPFLGAVQSPIQAFEQPRESLDAQTATTKKPIDPRDLLTLDTMNKKIHLRVDDFVRAAARALLGRASYEVALKAAYRAIKEQTEPEQRALEELSHAVAPSYWVALAATQPWFLTSDGVMENACIISENRDLVRFGLRGIALRKPPEPPKLPPHLQEAFKWIVPFA